MKKKSDKQEGERVRRMTVLLSELLVPGWADGPEGKIGVTNLADASLNLPCHNVDPETFFSENQATISYAKALCGECPMRAQCLEGALSRGEPCGVWGGELFDNGQVILVKRAPGRPRILPRIDQSEESLISGNLLTAEALAS